MRPFAILDGEVVLVGQQGVCLVANGFETAPEEFDMLGNLVDQGLIVSRELV
ncbi:hypothetical protein PXK48_16680 [Phaeobacter gallaeciensis]|uniref:hypothetical protein n=1 Tax=Phaeobacter gallaeciensis TaxID=60890 RepID=UPI00237F162F|nr:hypothetical protein [Phaeobacter gallaeciensis]MDE4062800.1 hypothetical protein [Phaeobacter gallaeciensis]MDE4130340.1 hypothetical protein [Phaeobacter gallaeciensis]